MGLATVRERLRSASTELYPEREWLACRLFVERERSFVAVIELEGPLFLYVYSDSYTLASGEAPSVSEALERMLPWGHALVDEALLAEVRAGEPA